jgi:hypothetical protein
MNICSMRGYVVFVAIGEEILCYRCKAISERVAVASCLLERATDIHSAI